jgi:aspartate kinase
MVNGISPSVKVAKFGGTSLADAEQFRKVQAIVLDDPERRYVVPSAPGKRFAADRKITDLLLLCHAHVEQQVPFDDIFGLIADRFLQIVTDLGLSLDLGPHLEAIKTEIAGGTSRDFAASRGEYLSGLILADLLGFQFVDPAEIIVIDRHGFYDPIRTIPLVSARLARHERAVIPGFFGTGPNGQIKTFPRGGSDITGAIIARGVGAGLYENWTDVSGFLMADPRVVANPRPIASVTYSELRELAYSGASVLQEDSIFPVRDVGIPINIRNTNEPDHPGTLIVADSAAAGQSGVITGIAGRRDFSTIAVAKTMMNAEIGFGRRLLSVLEKFSISFEHLPTGIDTMSVVISDAQLNGKQEDVVEGIWRECRPDAVDVLPSMALIATVGRGMADTPGVAGRLFGALGEAGVNIRMIDQGSSEINIIVGVETAEFERAVQAIYKAFVE